MRFKVFICLVFLGLLPARPVLGAEEKLVDVLVQNEVSLTRTASRSKSTPLLIVFQISGRRAQKVVHRALLQQVVLGSLSNAGVRVQVYARDIVLDLKQNILEPAMATGPKLVVDIRVSWNEESASYESQSTVSYIEYHPRANRTDYYAVIKWQKTQQITGVSGRELEENLINHLQKEMRSLRKILKNNESPRMMTRSGMVESPDTLGSTLSYQTKWMDPDARRGRFITGVSVGTPALFNLHLGYWGTRDLPVVFNISAMYIDSTNRGFQTEIGWAFDNEGSFKHGLGASLSWLTNQTVAQSQSQDVLGRITSVQQTTNISLRPFVGPTYFLDFHSVRLQVGATLPVSGDGSSTPRFLFQIGFIPPVGL